MRCKLVVLGMLMSAAGLSAQDPALEKAWSLAGRGDRSAAEAVLKDIVKNQPGNAEAHLFLGSLLLEEDKREESLAQLKQGAQLRPRSAEAMNALGEGYLHFADAPNARECFEKAVALDGKFSVAQLNLGTALLQSGDSPAAGNHLDIALRQHLKPADEAQAHYLRAKIYSQGGDEAKALSHLERSVTLDPDLAPAWSDLGLARRAHLDPSGALAGFQRAVELDPKDAVAQYRLGAEYLRQEQPEKALAPLQAANQLSPGEQSTLNALQNALRQTGRTSEATEIRRQLAEVLRKRDKGSQSALQALKLNNDGVELEKAGRLAQAAEKYREAVSLNPDHVGTRVNYAVALLRLGRWTDGLTELHEALERDPDNKQIQLAWKDALSQAPKDAIPAWGREGKEN